MTGYKSKRSAAQDKVTDIDGHVVRDVRKPRKLPQRPWVGLTDDDIKILWKATPQLVGVYSYTDIAKEVEATLRSKNT